MWNKCLRSRGGGILGRILGTSFVSVHGRKVGARKVSISGNLVGKEGGEIGVARMCQEDVI